MSERNRILHGLGALVAGGAERAAVDLMLGMRDKGLDVELVCLLPKRDGVGEQWASRLEEHGIPIHTGPTEKITLSTLFWLRRLLRAEDLALFHMHLNYVERAYCITRLMHRRKYGVIRKLHNSIMPKGGWQKWVLDYSDVRVSVANGETTRKNFEGKIKGEIPSIANGMNFHWPIRSEQETAQARQVLSLVEDKKHVVCVGSMVGEEVSSAQKAQDTLIKAWMDAGLGERAELHLLGDGNLRPQLEKQAKSDRSIVFHGVQPGIQRWLLACDVFVLPSRWEGLPNAAIEALGTGIPCVLSDIGPCRELETSMVRFAQPDEPKAFADQLSAQISEPPAINPQEIDEIRHTYGMSRPINAYLQAYARVLSLLPNTNEIRKRCG